MHPSNDNQLLLSDALDRTVANPLSSHCWINLMAQVRAMTNAADLAEVVEVIRTRLPRDGLGGFYRAGFLDLASGDLAYLGEAAAILSEMQPRDQDRLSAFFHFALQRVLLYSNNRTAFETDLHRIGLPSLARLTGYQGQTAHATAHATALATTNLPQRASGTLQKIALVATTLTTVSHPPTRMLLEQAEVLIEAGIAVTIYACQETMGPEFIHLLGQGAATPTQECDLNAWLARTKTPVGLAVANQRFSLMRRWRDTLAHLESNQPDLVMFIGLHSGLIAHLYQHYPILGMATNSVAPLVPTDVWLTAQQKLHGVEDDYWQAGGPRSLAYYHPFRAHRRACGPAAARHTLQIPEDAVLMISIGNKLNVQIAGRWAQRMADTLQKHPKLHWLLVGGEGKRPGALASLADERIHCLGHCNGVMEMIAMSDIYINPPMMGGGLSVSEAMSLGVPVLSFADCDGGDKLGGAVVADENDYFEQLERLIVDPALRASAGAALREHFAQAIDLAASGPSLLEACRITQQRFLQRQGFTPPALF